MLSHMTVLKAAGSFMRSLFLFPDCVIVWGTPLHPPKKKKNKA